MPAILTRTPHACAAQNLNHAISIVGWGVDAKEGPYWVGRNSWGHYWGELGFFRIERGNNTLGVESRCVWGTPGVCTRTRGPCACVRVR